MAGEASAVSAIGTMNSSSQTVGRRSFGVIYWVSESDTNRTLECHLESMVFLLVPNLVTTRKLLKPNKLPKLETLVTTHTRDFIGSPPRCRRGLTGRVESHRAR